MAIGLHTIIVLSPFFDCRIIVAGILVYLGTVMITMKSQLTTHVHIISNVNAMAGETCLVTKPNSESIAWTYFELEANW